MSVLGTLSAPRREVRVATVISAVGSVSVIDLDGSNVDATIPSTPVFALAADDTVFVIPVGDTWLVIAAL